MLKEKVKNFRKEMNLTQAQLAKALGVSRTNITEIERGKIKGSLNFIQKISEYSGKKISYWMDDNIEKNYSSYEALDIVIDALISKDRISSDGKIKSQEDKEIILAILEKEILLKLNKRKKQD